MQWKYNNLTCLIGKMEADNECWLEQQPVILLMKTGENFFLIWSTTSCHLLTFSNINKCSWQLTGSNNKTRLIHVVHVFWRVLSWQIHEQASLQHNRGLAPWWRLDIILSNNTNKDRDTQTDLVLCDHATLIFSMNLLPTRPTRDMLHSYLL